MPLAPIAAVEYFAAAPAFASDHGLGMAIAQLDLTNWSASLHRSSGELSSHGARHIATLGMAPGSRIARLMAAATDLFLEAPGADAGEIEQFLSEGNRIGTIRVTFEERTKLPPFERIHHQPGWQLDGKRDLRLFAESISRRILGEYRDNPGTAYSGATIVFKHKAEGRP